MRRNARRLLRLINQLLDLSKLEAGDVELDREMVELGRVVEETVQLRQIEAEQEDVDVRTEVPRSSLEGRWNRGALTRILANLLDNAIKFTPSGGQVFVRVHMRGEHAIIEVEDTGIGISPEQRPFLFRKFQQLDSSRQRSYEGMGLGLALTKQLVDLHGGQLEVKSEVGVGSIFTVRIPSQRVSEATDTADQRREVLPLSQRVVLFEEDEEAATVICDMLMAAGHQVIWMVDSTAVLEQVDLVEPNMVMIGFNLSSLDGQNIIHQLRQRLSVHPLKILALVEDGSEATKQQCLKAGADDCVAKPVQPQMLLHKINTLFYSPLT